MSGHVPKFGAANAGNFTEVFTLARGGGKGGSGDSAASHAEESSNPGPVYSSGRGGGRGGGAAAPPRRASDTGSTRSSQEGSLGSNRPSSPKSRREQRGGGVRGSQDGSQSQSQSRGAARNAPRNVNEEYAGASHLPKFGEWNAGDGETNYTVMFSAASKERKTGVTVDDAPMKGSGDAYSKSSRLPKKQSSCWSCF